MTNPVNTAILVFHSAGIVNHRFCDAAYAHQFQSDPSNRGCSIFSFEAADAEDIYRVSPATRERVESRKAKLREDLRIQAALDKHGVSPEIEVRHAVHKAFSELRFQLVRTALGLSSIGPADAESAACTQMTDVMDQFGVPNGEAIRRSVVAAFQDLLSH